jgi:T5SS/PEP-CTERM-associated repeat protein
LLAASGKQTLFLRSGKTFLGLNAGVHGIVNMSNANSTWTGGNMYVGYGGDGTVNVRSGGTLNNKAKRSS